VAVKVSGGAFSDVAVVLRISKLIKLNLAVLFKSYNFCELAYHGLVKTA
jgi:hypothetical protein